MNEAETKAIMEKLGGWERMIIFSSVVLTVPLFALLGTAIYSFITDRPAASAGLILSVVSLLVLWGIVWGLLWIVSGFNGQIVDSEAYFLTRLEELERENARLKEKLGGLPSDKP